MIKGFLISISLLPFLLMASFFPGHCQGEELSITALIIRSPERIIQEDYFFDIVDKGEYILLPASALSSPLHLQLTYYREKNLLLIESQITGKKVQVDLEKGEYLPHPQWSIHPPVLAQGDFFVTPLLLEYIAHLTVDWNPQRQEVTLLLQQDPPLSFPEEEEMPEPMEREIQERMPSVEGPSFSLGSIQYRIEYELRRDTKGTSQSRLIKNMALHGRAGGWALSGALQTGLSLAIQNPLEEGAFPTIEGDSSIQFPFLQALYQKNRHQIILGDSSFRLINTLGHRDLRGISYQYPDSIPSHLLAFTSIKGKGEKGDEVTLYRNQIPVQKQTVGADGVYYFPQVLLHIKRENRIKVVIESPDGVIKEKEKTVVASPRILEEGRKEFLLLLGDYRRPADSIWEGQTAGFSMKLALSQYKSLNWELMGKRPYLLQETGPLHTGSVLGMALKNRGRTVFTLDWYLGGKPEAELSSGYKSSLLYALEKGHWELKYDLFPAALKGIFLERMGEAWMTEASWSVNPNWALSIQGEHLKIPSPKPPVQEDRVEFTLINRDSFRRETRAGGVYREKRFELEAETPGLQFLSETGLLLQDHRDTRNMSTKLELSLFTSWRDYGGENLLKVDTIEVKSSLARRLTSSLFTSTEIQSTGRLVEDDLTQLQAKGELMLRWSPFQNTRLTLVKEMTGGLEGEEPFTEDASEIGLALRQNLSPFTSLHLEGKETRYPDIEGTHTRYQVGIRHFFASRTGRFTTNLGYQSPFTPGDNPQWTADLELTKAVSQNLEVRFRLYRIYPHLFDDWYEDIFTLSLSQSIGLAQGQAVHQRFSSDQQHVSFIGGRVFLDLNGNGLYDEGEPLLSGISMALDGRRTSTDSEGVFLFEYVWPGIYEVGFDLQSLDAKYSVMTPGKIVKIRENENLFLDFALTLNGAISGQVFLNEKADGVRSAEDRPLPWVGIKLVGTGMTVYTRENGSFYLEKIPLGTYKLKVLEDSLPPGMRVQGEKEIPIDITQEMLFLEGVEIPVIYGHR